MNIRCKIDGCDEPAVAAVGLYAKLCAAHKQAAKAAAPAKPKTGDGAAHAVAALRAPAVRFDRARAKIANLPPSQKAKEAFDTAARAATMEASAENLQRLTEATKQLQAGQPRREKLEADVAAAEKELRQAITGLVDALRTMLPPAAVVQLDKAA